MNYNSFCVLHFINGGVKRKSQNDSQSNAIRKKTKLPISLLSIRTKAAFIEEINRRLPDCLHIIVYDILPKDTRSKQYVDKDKEVLKQDFESTIQSVSLEGCTYNETNVPEDNVFLGMYLILDKRECIGSLEMMDLYNSEMHLYAKTAEQYYKQNIYKFLIGILVFYMGKFTNTIFISHAVAKASSMVLRRFKQTIIDIWQQQIPLSPTLTLDEKTNLISRNWDRSKVLRHKIIPSEQENIKVSLAMILHFLVTSASRRKCEHFRRILQNNSPSSVIQTSKKIIDKELNLPPILTTTNNDRLLIEAAGKGSNQDVQNILDKNADVNVTVGKGTPLTAAISNQHLDTVRLLLSRNADPNSTDLGAYFSPLKSAQRIGNQEIINVLKQHGAQ